MSTWRIAATLLLVLSVSSASIAQDQIEPVGGPKGSLSNGEVTSIRNGQLHGALARTLIQRMLSATGAPIALADDPQFNCIIHVVEWNGPKQEVKVQRWFLHRPGGPESEFDSLRMFGLRKVAILFLHLGAIGVPAGSGPLIAAAAGQPARAATAEEIREASLQRLDDGSYVQDFFARVNYRVDVVKKMPAPLANLGELIGAAQAGARQITVSEVGVWGGRSMEIRHVPSDMTARLLAGGSLAPAELGRQTYDNEGRYYWDASVAMPVTKLEQLKLDFESGSVTAKKIEKQGLLAVFNFFPRPIDTKGVRPSYVPHLLAGVGLSKKPLDTILLGLGIGINKAQLFAGVSWVRNDEGDGLTGGEPATTDAANRIRRRYDPKFVAGLNISVKQVLEALKK